MVNTQTKKLIFLDVGLSGFGGLAASMLAEAVEFFGCLNNPQHALLRRGSERICPMSQHRGM